LTTDWQYQALKQRIEIITHALHQNFSLNYSQITHCFIEIAPKFSGLLGLIFPHYIENYGLTEYELSIKTLEKITEFASAEFAIRAFIRQYPQATLLQLIQWTQSTNPHHRRLASEGCRPRLPWATPLIEFKRDPSPILPILTLLKTDNSEYVRKSVANNLNDIAKDHPEQMIALAYSWKGQHPYTDWIIKQGCRHLLKHSHPQVLALFNLAAPINIQITDFYCDPQVKLNHQLSFSFTLKTINKALGKLRIEYGIEFVKAHQKLARKFFKISEAYYAQTQKSIHKSYSFKPISTRKYYTGIHQLLIRINGKIIANKSFELFADNS
jgi:3-methyladenine DNA glycosylase AlkC